MELYNQSESARLQGKITVDAEHYVETVLARPAVYPDLAEQLYLVGATARPLLLAGHHQVSERLGTAKAEDWLQEHFRDLGTAISEGAKRSITITVTGSPKS